MKTLIAVPTFDMLHTDFMRSFVDLKKPPETSYTIIKNTLIYSARNIVAANAIEAGFDRVFWMDSDMTFPPDALLKLSKDMDEGRQFVGGLYFTRRPPKIRPIIYSELSLDGNTATEMTDYPEGIVECAATGFGCCLVTVDLIKRVGDEFGSPFTPFSNMGEDIAFCWRAGQLGEKLYCDTTVKCGHIGSQEFNEAYFKAHRAGMLQEE